MSVSIRIKQVAAMPPSVDELLMTVFYCNGLEIQHSKYYTTLYANVFGRPLDANNASSSPNFLGPSPTRV